MSFNPCCCWRLKDGCVTIGIWSLIFSIAQLGIFGWQTADIKWRKDRAHNNLLPVWGTYESYESRWPGYYQKHYESPEERYFTGIFVIQIVNLIACFLLLFASVALIYGIHSNSRYLVWPWFPCMVTCMLCSLAYCVIWWTWRVEDYWLVLTIIQIMSVFVNAYCLLCVVVQYRRIARGIPDTKDEYHHDYAPPKSTMVYYGDGQTRPTGTITKTVHLGISDKGGQYNPAYDHHESKFPYDPVHLHQPPAEEIPAKTYPEEPFARRDVEADPNVQQWLETMVPAAEPQEEEVRYDEEVQQPHTEPSSPTKLEPVKDNLRHARSVPSVVEEDKGRKHRSRHRHGKHHHHHHGRHRSSSVGSKGHRSRKSGRSSSSDDSDDSDQKSRDSRHRGKHHRSHSRDKVSDSDTGFSQSEKGERKHRRQEHSDDKSRRHKRPREVKREDKERSGREAPVPPARPDTSNSDPSSSWPPKISPVPGGITIPQHIVIPPNPRANPQRFHINSEITISYSDRSTNPSESDALRRGMWATTAGPRVRQLPEQTGPTIRSPTDGEQDDSAEHIRNSYGADSDSKGYGSTAV